MITLEDEHSDSFIQFLKDEGYYDKWNNAHIQDEKYRKNSEWSISRCKTPEWILYELIREQQFWESIS